MPQYQQDKIKLAPVFWRALENLGVTRQALCAQAGLPAAVLLNQADANTKQFFAIWSALPKLSDNPEVGIAFAKALSMSQLPPELFAASIAKTYREALQRIARFKFLCAPERIVIDELTDHCTISLEWAVGTETMPDALVDTTFMVLLGLGGEAVRSQIQIHKLQLTRGSQGMSYLQNHFPMKIEFNAPRNALVLDSRSLDLSLETYNQGLAEMLLPQLEQQLAIIDAPHSTCDQVQWVLEQFLSSGSPTIAQVASELGCSVRTLQRRITQEGQTFKGLLNIVRLRMAKSYLMDSGLSLNEIAVLLGYEDQNSFYRAFKQMEGETPSNWREGQQV